MSETQKEQPVKVWLVNPPIQDPWRTRGEYQEEQQRVRKLYLIAFASLIIAGLGATAQGAGVILTALKPSLVRVECVAPPSNAPTTEKIPAKSPK